VAENEYDLTALLRGIGVKGTQGKLDLVELLQPTLQVGDLAAMGPAILPPMSAFGGQQGALLAEFSCFQLTISNKGGSYIQFTAFSTVNNIISWEVLDVALPLSPSATLVNVRLAHQASTVTAARGNNVGGLTLRQNRPQFLFGGVQTIFVEPGRFLFVQGSSTNALISGQFLVQDVPVQLPPDAGTATLP